MTMGYTEARKQAIEEAKIKKAEGFFSVNDPFDRYFRDWVDNRTMQLMYK